MSGTSMQQHVRGQVREHHRVDEAEARRDARGRERGDGRQHVGAEEDRAEAAGSTPEPLRGTRTRCSPAMTKPPANASSANSAARRSTTRCDRCSPKAGGRSTASTRRDLDRRRDSRTNRTASSQPEERVADDDRPVGVEPAPCRPRRARPRDEPGGERPGRGRDRADEVVPGEDARPARARRDLG